MKKISVFLTSLLLLGGWAATAQAVTEPTNQAAFTTGFAPGAPNNYAPAWMTTSPAPYWRNIFWDFNSDPTLTKGSYYGTADTQSPTLKNSDTLFTFGTNVAWSSANKDIGVGKNQTAANQTASFTLTNLTTPGDVNHTQYVYAQMDILTTGSGWVEFNNFVPAGNSSTVSAAQLKDSSGNILASTAANLFTTHMTTSGIYYAWFQVNNLPTSEAFTFTLNSGANGTGNSASLESLHIATTPEPIALALFATGVGVLFFFRRRFGLQVA
jgi:hypothetical protein